MGKRQQPVCVHRSSRARQTKSLRFHVLGGGELQTRLVRVLSLSKQRPARSKMFARGLEPMPPAAAIPIIELESTREGRTLHAPASPSNRLRGADLALVVLLVLGALLVSILTALWFTPIRRSEFEADCAALEGRPLLVVPGGDSVCLTWQVVSKTE